ncbi:restriction endonuclease subunit S [Akkermansia muciniphila]|uniref:restriction endonuclease subunit S n=3 Tax=Akkermansia muciniphila TaxID=239935 RepID=UPI000FE15BEE|nr:restriction endonuclease subunit S [Akkermansia muciniphila]QAA53648.1 restriction endonuclease subunit S [Akkermansia muciniphila]QAA55957.1 restriction endonuclease subunit S [Akkermansia muciniphila]QAA58270.1 restriction endonuclease subunit S [Akkermansia muciniphila]QAA60608.1 restriction endonuclease subunit S [Akkermansia muciniphila]QWO98187.1 restriction endonuclease subunit S [Akkermansia muciniphila]
MKEWKNCTLGELGNIVGGATPSTKKFENYEGGTIPWITPKDLSGFLERYIAQGERNITEAGLRSCSAQLLPKHSILFSSRAPIGYIAIAACEVCTNQGFKSIIPNNDVDYMFLYYLLKFKKGEIENMGSGTTFKEVSAGVMKNIQVRVPAEKSVQIKIAKILSSLDDKIELNNRINDNLLEQALTLYKKYFPYNVDDEFPNGWRIGTVGEIIEIHDSKRIPLSSAERMKMTRKIYPYYGAASLMDYVDDFIFNGKYLLLGEDGTVVDSSGYPILQYVCGKFWVNNHTHILTGKLGFNVESLYMLFKQTPVKSIVTGAVQPKISQTNLRSIRVVIPPKKLLKDYNCLVDPLFSLFRLNKEENKSLATLRDTLLPKLMSGEIDVSSVKI